MQFEDMYVLANQDLEITVGEKTYTFKAGQVYFFSAEELAEIAATDPMAAYTFMQYVDQGVLQIVSEITANIFSLQNFYYSGKWYEQNNVYQITEWDYILQGLEQQGLIEVSSGENTNYIPFMATKSFSDPVLGISLAGNEIVILPTQNEFDIREDEIMSLI